MVLHQLLWFFFVLQVSHQSGPEAYVPFFNTAPLSDSPSTLGENIRGIIDRYEFSCNGTISEWQAYVVGRGAHPLEFHVWRSVPDTGGESFLLVGSNVFASVQPTGDLLTLAIPPEERIQVQAGDIVGIRTVRSNQTEDNFRIQALLVGSSTFYTIPDDEDTPSLLVLTGLFRFELLLSPLINVVLVSDQDDLNQEENGTEPIEPETDSGGPDPVDGISLTTVVAASTISAAVFIAAVSVTTIVLVGCCVKKSLTNKTRRVDPDTEMQRNHAYDSAASSGNATAAPIRNSHMENNGAYISAVAEGASVSGEEVRPQSDGYVYVSGSLYEHVN